MINKIRSSTSYQILILCLLGILTWAITLYLHPDTPASSDAAPYASAARNLLNGYGFTMPMTYPLFLSYNIPLNDFGWPAFVPHLYPLVTAFFFLFLGINDFSLASTSGFFFLLTIPFLYLLAQKIFNRQVAFLASIWYIFNPSILTYAVWGIPKMLFIFLITFGFFLLLVKKRVFWTGIVFGLLYLTKFQGIIIFPILFLHILKKWGYFSSFLLLLGFISIFVLKKIIFIPLATDYSNIYNSPLWDSIAYDAFFTPAQTGRMLNSTSLFQIFAHSDLIFGKFLKNFYYFLQNFFNTTTPAVIFLYVLSFFKSDLGKEAKHLKILSLIFIILFLLFYIFTFFGPRYIHSVLPLVIIIAAATLLSFLQKFSPKRILPLTFAFTSLFIIIPTFTSPFGGSSIRWALASPREPTLDSLIGQIAQKNTLPEAITVSNFPHVIAWYGERKAIALPLNRADLKKIDEEFAPVDFLLLAKTYGWPPLESEWEELIANPQDFGNFHLLENYEIKPEENYHRLWVKVLLYKRVM